MSSDRTQRRGLLARAGGTSVATRLATAVIALAMVSLLIATFVGVRTGNRLGRDTINEQLNAMRASSTLEIEASVDSLLNSTAASAASPMASDALTQFSAAYRDLGSITAQEVADELEQVIDTLSEFYLEPLRSQADAEVNLRDVISPNPAATYLQFQYPTLAANEGIDATVIDDPLDGSQWTEVHKQFHPIYRDLVEQQHLADLMLVDTTSATIVYSVSKRPDFGTSLRTGPFSGTAVATLVEEVISNPDAGVRMSDLSFYDPALFMPVGFVAAPVTSGSRLDGVMVFEYPIERFGALLTADLDWDGAGIHRAAQTYMFGSDDRTRSIDRSFVENPTEYLETLIDSGTIDQEEAALIESAETTALTIRADDTTLEAASTNRQATLVGPNLQGVDTIRSVRKLDLDDVDWWLVSEAETTDVQNSLTAFRNNLVVGSALFMVAVAFFAVYWARSLLRPVRTISDQLGSDKIVDKLHIDLPARSPIEFRDLAGRFEEMAQSLDSQQRAIASVRDERLSLLRQVLPDSFTPGVDGLDYDSVTRAPRATVSVLTVTGLSDLLKVGSDSASRSLIELVHASLDAVAEQHGVERIKVVGDAYFAACGQDRPYLDHTPRCVQFALEARSAIVELGATHGHTLDVASGIDTGPVLVGMAGGSRLLYDIWGVTANNAHLLARGGRSGQVRISNEVRRRLPADYRIDDGPLGPAGEATWIVQPPDADSER